MLIYWEIINGMRNVFLRGAKWRLLPVLIAIRLGRCCVKDLIEFLEKKTINIQNSNNSKSNFEKIWPISNFSAQTLSLNFSKNFSNSAWKVQGSELTLKRHIKDHNFFPASLFNSFHVNNESTLNTHLTLILTQLKAIMWKGNLV